MKLLVLTRYDRLGASSRVRFFQYFSFLKFAGLQFAVSPLISDVMLISLYSNRGYSLFAILRSYFARIQVLFSAREYDLVWIEKEALPWWPLWMELVLLRRVPYVLDYDDAIFHNYDQHANAGVRRMFGRRLDGLMGQAALVVGGNTYLAQRARDAGAPWVEVVPTVIDLLRYPSQPKVRVEPPPDGVLPRIVWIGSPTTVQYLKMLREPLRALALHHPFVLRVIGGGVVDIPGVQVEVVSWTEATEVENIRACQVGVMPLLDSVWERGKCGYKIIQYMACSLPVVASAVGVNPEIVCHGENGFLANNPQDWVDALGKLLADASLRAAMGAEGRRRVESEYCIQKAGPRMAQLLRLAAEKK